jgi:hypothetical protein
MVEVHLAGVNIEHQKKALKDKIFGQKDGRWFARVALNLIDNETKIM